MPGIAAQKKLTLTALAPAFLRNMNCLHHGPKSPSRLNCNFRPGCKLLRLSGCKGLDKEPKIPALFIDIDSFKGISAGSTYFC